MLCMMEIVVHDQKFQPTRPSMSAGCLIDVKQQRGLSRCNTPLQRAQFFW